MWLVDDTTTASFALRKHGLPTRAKKERDTLFILKREEEKLITEWKTFTPMLQEDFKNGIECFKKVK